MNARRFATRRGAHYLELPDHNHITAFLAVDEVIAGLDVFFARARLLDQSRTR